MGIRENQARGRKGENIYELTHPGANRTGRGSDFDYDGELIDVKTGNAKLSPLQREMGAKEYRFQDRDVLDQVPDPERVRDAIYRKRK